MTIEHLTGFFVGACTAITTFSLIGGLTMQRSHKRTRATLARHRELTDEAARGAGQHSL